METTSASANLPTTPFYPSLGLPKVTQCPSGAYPVAFATAWQCGELTLPKHIYCASEFYPVYQATSKGMEWQCTNGKIMKSDLGYNPNSSNQVTLSNAVFSNCTASLGGVIYAKNADKNLHLQVTISNSKFDSNFA